MRFTTRDGRKLTYRKLGHGPALVCHPGGPGLSSAYLGDLAGLWERFTLVMLNPRGTLGYSHGGLVAQAYALAHPARVQKLVLAATASRFGPEQEVATNAAKEKRTGQPWYADANAASSEDIEHVTDEQLRDLLFRQMPLYFAHFGAAEAGYLDTFRAETMNGDALRAFDAEIASLDLLGRLAGLTIPTLVITGEEDFICGPVCAEEMSTAIPAAQKVIVGDAGHMVFMEQPQRFHDAVADFLES